MNMKADVIANAKKPRKSCAVPGFSFGLKSINTTILVKILCWSTDKAEILSQSRIPSQGAGQMRTVHGVEMDAFDAVLQKVLDLLTGVL